MKKVIKFLIQFKQLIISIYRDCFNIYPYEILHNGCGMYEYNVELFKEEKPFILKTLKRMSRLKIKPNINDMIFGYDNVYTIKGICYFKSHCLFLVDEVKNRENN